MLSPRLASWINLGNIGRVKQCKASQAGGKGIEGVRARRERSSARALFAAKWFNSAAPQKFPQLGEKFVIDLFIKDHPAQRMGLFFDSQNDLLQSGFFLISCYVIRIMKIFFFVFLMTNLKFILHKRLKTK